MPKNTLLRKKYILKIAGSSATKFPPLALGPYAESSLAHAV